MVRRAQGDALAASGLGPVECLYRLLASSARWRLRDYAGEGPGPIVLIVAAPIKRPYVWDLAPSVSAVRQCLRHGLRVYLLEWMPVSRADAELGLFAYAARSIREAVAALSKETGGAKPFLMGHSLGGTLAALYAALDRQALRGLVLLSAPLSFEPGSSRFRDSIVSMMPPSVATTDVVPGFLLSQLCALASPETFVWSRFMDAALSIGDLEALKINGRVERWSLDELALPGRLIGEIFQWLYREDRFYRGTLRIEAKKLGPSSLRLPTLAVVNAADKIAPAASITPFIAAMPEKNKHLIGYSGEFGVGMQHLALLVGRKAHALIWPEIIAWLQVQG